MQAMVNKSKQLFLFFECQNNQFRTSQLREAAERYKQLFQKYS